MGPGIGPGWGFRFCLLLWSPFLPGSAHLQNGSSMPVVNTDVRNVRSPQWCRLVPLASKMLLSEMLWHGDCFSSWWHFALHTLRPLNLCFPYFSTSFQAPPHVFFLPFCVCVCGGVSLYAFGDDQTTLWELVHSKSGCQSWRQAP